MGNDEYNRESEEGGGGANQVKATYSMEETKHRKAEVSRGCGNHAGRGR